MFNKTNLPLIRKDIDAALAEVAKKHGINLSIGNIRFTADSFRTTLNATAKVAASNAPAVPEEMLALMGYGMVMLGKSFDVKGIYTSPTLGLVKFVGYHPRKPKYPFIVATPTGKRFKITSEAAKSIVAAVK